MLYVFHTKTCSTGVKLKTFCFLPLILIYLTYFYQFKLSPGYLSLNISTRTVYSRVKVWWATFSLPLLIHLQSRVNLGKVRKQCFTTVFGKTTFIDNTLTVIMYTLHVYFNILSTTVEERRIFDLIQCWPIRKKIKFMMSSSRSLRFILFTCI